MPQFFEEWEEGTFFCRGQKLRLKVKVPLFDEAPEFLRQMNSFGRASDRANDSLKSGREIPAEDADSVFSAIDPKWARGVFAKCVLPAEPIVVQSRGADAKPIQTGEEVYEIANTPLVLQVLMRIHSMGMMGEVEGKASSSPSTSDAGTGKADGGDSLATSIGPEAGIAP